MFAAFLQKLSFKTILTQKQSSPEQQNKQEHISEEQVIDTKYIQVDKSMINNINSMKIQRVYSLQSSESDEKQHHLQDSNHHNRNKKIHKSGGHIFSSLMSSKKKSVLQRNRKTSWNQSEKIDQNHPEQEYRKCLLKWQNGTFYHGQIKDNKMHGNGKLCFPNGDYFDGQFHVNQFHGLGHYYTHTGQQYQGEWYNDKKHGYGKQNMNNSVSYMGQYQQGKKQGHGYIQWADGVYYEGNFMNDRIEGSGKMVMTDGTVYEGQWINGSLEGLGLQIKQNNIQQDILIKTIIGQKQADSKKSIEDQIQNDSQQGDDSLKLEIHSQKTIYQGQFCKGKKNGRGSVIVSAICSNKYQENGSKVNQMELSQSLKKVKNINLLEVRKLLEMKSVISQMSNTNNSNNTLSTISNDDVN